LQDDDGTAYIIYTAHISGYPTTHQMSVEQLTDDYTASLVRQPGGHAACHCAVDW